MAQGETEVRFLTSGMLVNLGKSEVSPFFLSLNFSLFWQKAVLKIGLFFLEKRKVDHFHQNFQCFQGILAKSLENLTNFFKIFKIFRKLTFFEWVKWVNGLGFFEKLDKKRSNSPSFLLKYLENIENFEGNQLPFFKEK